MADPLQDANTAFMQWIADNVLIVVGLAVILIFFFLYILFWRGRPSGESIGAFFNEAIRNGLDGVGTVMGRLFANTVIRLLAYIVLLGVIVFGIDYFVLNGQIVDFVQSLFGATP